MKPRRSALTAALDTIERIGNALPNPATLFLILAAIVVVASAVTSSLGVTVLHPRDGTPITAVNLLSGEGIRRMFTQAVKNFTGFAPLGTVLVAMLGIGVAEATGLIAVAMRAFVMAVPRHLLTVAVVFIGVNGSLAADAGLIILPPLGALLFAAAGRHPLAGLVAAYAGVAGGFGANVLPSTLDVLLAGFTQEAITASKMLPGYHVNMLGNYWFMASAAPLLTLAGTLVTDRIIEPRLGPWKGEAHGPLEPLTHDERRGLIAAGVAALVTALGFLALVMPGWGPLRAEGASTIERLKPFFESLVVLVLLGFFVPGLVYGLVTRKIQSDHDVARITTETVATMAGYIVMAFCCAQFVSYFAWSNLGGMVAITGAQALKGIGLEGAALLIGLILFAATMNLLITSSSAMWAIIGPIFVPMFALLGFTPEGTQAAYRVGESSTNIITPLLPYMPFILAAVQRYDKKAGTGTLISLMIPYALVFLVTWMALLLVFYALGWDIGPGVGMRLG